MNSRVSIIHSKSFKFTITYVSPVPLTPASINSDKFLLTRNQKETLTKDKNILKLIWFSIWTYRSSGR